MKLLKHWSSTFFALASCLLLAPSLCGCRASAPKPPPMIVEEVPPQVRLRLQVIALRETASPADGAPFPALGFQFAGDRVVPVETPDTIAGVELTMPQLVRWMENLRKAGAKLYAAPDFTVGPNLSASSVNSAEKQYQANWRVDSNGASMKSDTVVPELKFNVQPDLVPGTRALLTSVDAEIGSADLDPFTVVDNFAAKDKKPIPLALLLPRQAIRRMITQALVPPDRTLILAHYVKQYRSSPQPPIRGSQGGPEPESRRPPAAAEDVREHIFYVLSAERRGPEARSDLPIVPQIPPRYALSLTWLESQDAAPPAQPPAPAKPATSTAGKSAQDDLAELQQAAGWMKDAPEAVVQTLAMALTTGTQTQFEVAEERACVAGLHQDSTDAASPYNFLIQKTWSGIKLSAQLNPAPQAGKPSTSLPAGRVAGPAVKPATQDISAALTLRLATLPQFDDAVGQLPSLRAAMPAGGSPASGAAAPEPDVKEYHFQIPGQASAGFAATRLLQPGQTRLQPLAWHTTGLPAAPNASLRLAAVTLSEAPAPAAEPPPQSSAPAAPAHP